MAWLYWGDLGDGVAHLDGDEARHAIRVARVRVGERISVGDGRGRIATGAVTAVDARVEVRIEELREEPRPVLETWLVQALAKGDRDELAIQAATELGVSGVVPWQAERSISRWDGSRAAKGLARWGSIVREASKQSIRSWIPEVAPFATTRDLAALTGSVLVLDPAAPEGLSTVALPASGRISVVVGPEGGVTPGELAALAASGARAVRLGDEVLRTSTAGPAALALLNLRTGRW